jgi:hypothetical protein
VLVLTAESAGHGAGVVTGPALGSARGPGQFADHLYSNQLMLTCHNSPSSRQVKGKGTVEVRTGLPLRVKNDRDSHAKTVELGTYAN